MRYVLSLCLRGNVSTRQTEKHDDAEREAQRKWIEVQERMRGNWNGYDLSKT